MIKNPKIPVVILCGGKGSRFSKLNEMPKQLSLLNGKPLIMHIIDHFYNSGLNFIILPLGFKKKMFFKFFKSKIKMLPPRSGERYASALTNMQLFNKVYKIFGKTNLENYIKEFIEYRQK